MDGTRRTRVVSLVFGDRTGLVLFLGVLSVLGVLGRLDILINDSQTVLNTLYNLERGHLHFVEAPYGDRSVPGDHLVAGKRYGRNYGQAAIALPFSLAFRLVSRVVPLRLVIVGCWIVVTAGFLRGVHRLTDRTRPVVAGGVGAAALVAGSVFLRPAWDADPTVVGLLTSTAVAGGLCSVLVYRLIADTFDGRVGLYCGVATMFTLPVGLWSLLPKRHALSTLFVLGSVYAFARSRSVGATRADARRGRAIAYACVGLLSWVHAAEAATLAIALLIVDIPTAPYNDWRTVALVGGTFLLSAMPTLLTNVAISGNPLGAPRLLPEFAPGGEPGGAPGGGFGGGSGGTGGGSNPLVLLMRRYVQGAIVLADPLRVQRIFLWSGTAAQRIVIPPFRPGTNLSVFESAPVLGALSGAVGAGVRKARSDGIGSVLPRRRHCQYALVVSLAYLLLFFPSLPVRVQLTSRYLLPVFPLALVGAAHVGVNREAVRDHAATVRDAAVTATLGVAVGVPALAYTADFHLGQVFLAHALLNLVAWGVLAVVSFRAGLRNRGEQLLAGALGVAAGFGAALVLDVFLVYFHYGPSLLPVVETATRLLWRNLVIY